MTMIVGVLGAAVLFGLFSALRPRDSACTGHCAGCTRDGACDSKEKGVGGGREHSRSAE